MASPPQISLRAEPIFHLGSFTVTNALLASVIVIAILIIGAIVLRKKLKTIPGHFQGVTELAAESLLDLMESVLGTRRAAEQYLPLIATIFLFVICSNWLGLVPGFSSLILHVGSGTVPLLRSPSADLNFTLALAICAVLAVNVLGAAALGTLRYSKKFFNFSSPVMFGIGLLEFLSEFARMVSFSFRLFGNVFAGEVLLTIIAFLIPYLVPLPFLFLELFVGAIQAFIFSTLTLVFISAAVAEHGEH
jgi:F-type H+-transporting ATPase subunit a